MEFCRKCLAWRASQDRPSSLIGIMLGAVDSGKTSALARVVALYGLDPKLGRQDAEPPGPIPLHGQDKDGKSTYRGSAYYIRADMLPSPKTSISGWISRAHEDQFAQRDLIMSADFLAIDEIGTEENPDWIVKTCLIRYDLRKATILAGNVDGKPLGDRYKDPRFSSRTWGRQGLPFSPVIKLSQERLSKTGPRRP